MQKVYEGQLIILTLFTSAPGFQNISWAAGVDSGEAKQQKSILLIIGAYPRGYWARDTQAPPTVSDWTVKATYSRNNSTKWTEKPYVEKKH